MSRMHRRDPRGDWSLDFVHSVPYNSWSYGGGFYSGFPGPVRYLVSLAVTRDEAYRLAESRTRGTVTFQTAYSYASGDQMWASGIEVTAQEADWIRRGEHPRDVLFGPPPACGYRLFAVAENF